MGLPDIPPGLEKRANDALDAVVADLAARQTAYAAMHNGRFWQGIQVAPIPADGADITPDKSKKPTDQNESWQDLGVVIPDHCPITIEVDVYDGHLGTGYAVRGEISVAGQLWMRSVGVGKYAPTYDWTEVPSGGF